MTVLCRVMQVRTSAYYDWLKAPTDSDKEQQDRKITETAKQIFIDNKQCFDSRRLADRLQNRGLLPVALKRGDSVINEITLLRQGA